MSPQKVILDVDTGHDDAAAILLAGHHPALELVALTVCHGNDFLPATLENTLRTVEAGKLSHIPVFPGAECSLLGKVTPGGGIQSTPLPLPPTSIQPQSRHAVDFLVEYFMGPMGPGTIMVPMGTHTNLALALLKEPRLKQRIPRIVTMAGSYLGGNTTPSAEFNVYADPEAARVVFNSGIPLTMVGLEVTAQALITLEDADRIEQLGTPWAWAAAEVIRGETRWQMEFTGNNTGGQIFDACAVAAVIDPAHIHTSPMHVDIELYGELTRGRTVADISGRIHKTPNVDVGMDIDRSRFMEILFEGLK